jgi:hypothetical protein
VLGYAITRQDLGALAFGVTHPTGLTLLAKVLLFLLFFATAVAHGGNPQDRAASSLRPLREIKNYLCTLTP